MKFNRQLMAVILLASAPVLVGAQTKAPVKSSTDPKAVTTDQETGSATRAWLNEQAQGVNRADTEPYRAESAGKAYRAYVDAIGTKDQAPTSSQLSTINTK